MLMERLRERKTLRILLGVAVGAVILALYLSAMFRPGLRYFDTFLYQQKDGSFSGADGDVRYRMEMSPAEGGKEILFAVNDLTHRYQIHTDPTDVQIFRDGSLVFRGTNSNTAGTGLLLDENGRFVDVGVAVTMGNVTPDPSKLFPSLSQLYCWAATEPVENHGEPIALLYIAVIAIALILDIVFPDLAYYLRHGLEVDGGEPSDFYRFNQRLGRIVGVIGILVIMIMSW